MSSTITEARVTTEQVRERLAAHDLSLPRPWQLPLTTKIPSSLVRVVGDTAYVSGHVPTEDDGNLAAHLTGRIGAEVDLETAQRAAIRTMLAIIADLDQALGDLSRERAWLRLQCMAWAVDGFADYPAVFNPASALLNDLFGEEAGTHARAAVGMQGLPWNMPVEIEAQLLVRPSAEGGLL